MAYEMNMAGVSLEAYRAHLAQQELLPSRKILHEELDARFAALKAAGIDHLAALRKAIGNAGKIDEVSNKTGVPADYLNILRREIGSLVPKRIKIADFPNVCENTAATLAQNGVRNSKDFFDKLTEKDANALGIGAEEYADIRSLCDIARISGMGAIAARIFVDAGYTSVDTIAQSDAQTMWEETCTVNDEKEYYGGVLSVKDMQFCIDYANMMRQLSK